MGADRGGDVDSASELADYDIEIPADDWFVARNPTEAGSLADRLVMIWAEELDRLVFAGAPEALREAS